MKKIFVIAAVLTAFVSYSQDNAVKILKQYGFTTKNVLSVIDISSSSYTFTANCTTKTHSDANHTDNTSTRVYTFDGKKPEGEKYTLVSIKGQAPSKRKIKKFNKEKNAYDKGPNLSLSDKDFFVKSNDDNATVIGFNMPKEELPSKMAYMVHSTGFIYIDKKTGKITKLEIKSKESFNMKIFHVVSLSIVMNIKYDTEHKAYFLANEITDMNVLIFGSTTNINTIEDYSNFKF